jgi:beta-galactosidase
MLKILLLSLMLMEVLAMKAFEMNPEMTDERGLASVYRDFFSIGAAINPSVISEKDSVLLIQQFNSITAENSMKPESLHPSEGTWNWTKADQLVNFAIRNGMKVRGHCLVWHQQTPNWFFVDGDKPASKELVLKRMKEHIFTVINHFKGRVYCWDVVNEAVADDSTIIYRDKGSKWFQIAGEDFIAKAFEFAHEADPQAILFYNDYNCTRPEKRERIYKMLKKLIDKGVPVQGMGMQGHWSIFEPSEQELRTAMERYSSLGIKIQITELDLSVYKWEKESRKRVDMEDDPFTPEQEKLQVEKYDMIFRVFRDYRKVITGVTFWGVADHRSWLNNYPVRGRKNYPLLFDRNLNPKKSYFKVVDFNNTQAKQTSFLSDPFKFLENPAIYELNQLEGHSVCIPAKSSEEALNLQKSKSENVLMLNGTWKFYFANTPEGTPKDFFLPKFKDAGWSDIMVPSNWEMQGFGDPLFRNVNQPFRANPPFIPREYNPTGSYRRTFTLPVGWKGKPIYLRMEKTASASFVWINGKEVGYNEGAQEPAEYDVTEFVKPGENTLAVNVYKYSDGVFLECQDYWRLAGIFDDIWMYTTPEVHLFDWVATTDLDEKYADATLKLQIAVTNRSKNTKTDYKIRTSLLDENNAIVKTITSDTFSIEAGKKQTVQLSSNITNPQKWSAEDPNLYHLAMELINAEGKTDEVIAGRIGFKETEIRHQVFYLNGKAIKLNGINSHMQHPETGHAMDEATIRKDFEILKQFNINCVRTSHYPPVSRYLELADEYGIYVIDETGDESHATEYVSKNPDWEPMYRERARKMVLRDRNHPSILFWSAGNESGEGQNICAVINEGRKYDSTRYWMYGGNAFAHPCEEIIGPRYPTPFELKTEVGMISEKEDPRPSFMDEYLSVAGNGGGALDDYWDVIYKYPRIMGGAIWDFVSPGLREPIRKLEDSSKNKVPAHIMGRAKIAEGHQGKGIDLNGHDQWVEVYQSNNLEISGKELTLSLWVFPRNLMSRGGTLLTKGNNQFGLQQVGKDSIDFYLYTSKRVSVRAALPKDWEQNWHHVAAVYNGKSMAIFIDNKKLVEKSVSGNLANFPFPLNIGRNSELHGQETNVYLCDAVMDQVAVFTKAMDVNDLYSSKPELKNSAAIWLDFENEQNEGQFFSYGIGARTYGCIWPDRVPEPEMWQMKKSAQPVSVKWSDKKKMEIMILNRFFFTSLKTIEARWNLEENGISVATGKFDAKANPQGWEIVRLPITKPLIKAGASYLLTVSFHSKAQTKWAPKGFELAWDQLEMPWSVQSMQAPAALQTKSLKVDDSEGWLKITGTNFEYTFSTVDGRLKSLKSNGKELLKQGPQLNAWRAPLANEQDNWTTYSVNVIPKTEGYGNMISTSWYALGLDRMKYTLETFECKIENEQVVVHTHEIVLFGNSSNSGFDNDVIYTISGDGMMEMNHTINPSGKMPVWLPRIGTSWILDQDLKQVGWFGRGPQENYPDRKSGYRIGSYQSTVEGMFVPYLLPEDCGLRTDNKWVRFLNSDGAGLEFSAQQPFNFNCYNYSTENLSKSKYTCQLVKTDAITFNFDYQTTGVGCTARAVFNKYQTIPKFIQFTSFIKPVGKL